MKTLVHAEEGEVNGRLAELGAPKVLLLQAVRGAVAAYDGCTDNDPPGARGYEIYRVGTRDLRTALLSVGWERDSSGNLASAVNLGTQVRVVVLNTDGATGIPDHPRGPTNRREKGVLHERAIDGDSLFLPGMGPEEEVSLKIWYLCLNILGSNVSAELSRPAAIVDGYIVGWEERIMLVQPGDWDSLEFDDGDADQGPDFDVEVRRKK